MIVKCNLSQGKSLFLNNLSMELASASIKKRKDPQVIVFQERPYKLISNSGYRVPAPSQKSIDSKASVKEFDMKKARYDVLRFGMAGFDKEKQKKDKISMAIRLGAKPPKKEYKNYKELMLEKQAQKEEDMLDKMLKQYCLEIMKQKKRTRPNKKMKKKKTE